MGKQSNLGPFDPHISGIPTQGVLEEFEKAAKETKEDPSKVDVWRMIIGRYPPSFIIQCMNAVEWSKSLVSEWLRSGMLADRSEKDETAKEIVDFLSSMKETKNHSRHIGISQCKKLGLMIGELEADNELQDLVLTVHHTYMHTFAQSSAVKIIENHEGVAMVLHASQLMIQK